MKKIIKKSLLLFTLTVFMSLAFSLCTFAACNDHVYVEKVIYATLTEDGHITSKCENCGQILEDRDIPKIKTVKLKNSKFVYNGDYVFPNVIIKDAEGNTIESYDYTFSYKSAKKIGTYTATVTFNNYYKGTVKLTYKIVSPISTPKLKVATSTTEGAKIEWEKQKSATGYIVYRKSGNGDWKKLGTTKKTYYVDSTAVYNKTYKYTVKAYLNPDKGSNITSSYNKNGITLKMAKVVTPSAPTVSSKSLYASIKIKEVKGATSYKIYKATSKNGKYKLIQTTKKGVLSYTDKNVKINKTYYYKIRVYVGSKASSLSEYSKVIIKLDAPEINKTVNVTSSTATFKWDKVKGADYYRIYHRKNVRSDWKRVKTVKAGDSLTYKGKLPDKINQFAVIAYKKLSSKTTVKSSKSEILYANPIKKPTISMNFPEATSMLVSTTIDIGGMADYYIVYCKQGKNGNWKAVKNSYNNFIDKIRYVQAVKPDTTYYFKVKSYYISDDFKIYGPTSETVSVMLHYNPDVEVILPKESMKEGALFPVTVKNNSASTLRLYPDAYIKNSDISKCGDITVYDFYGEYINENGYIDIAPYSSVTVSFGRKRNYAQYNRKCSVVFKFRHNGADYYSSYSNYYGESFKLNKE